MAFKYELIVRSSIRLNKGKGSGKCPVVVLAVRWSTLVTVVLTNPEGTHTEL